MKILNTDLRIYKVKFMWVSANGEFICNHSELMNVLKQHEEKEIKSIKVYNPSTEKFVRVSKSDILNFSNWDTQQYLYLQNHYYFK